MDNQDSDFDHLTSSAVACLRAGRADEAIEAYRAALRIQPNNAVLLSNLGLLIAKQGDHQAALQYFDNALRCDPRYVSAHFNRGAALDKLGEEEAAIAAFARVVVLDPAHYAAHRALAFSLLAKNHRGRAMDHFARTYELRRGEDRTTLAAHSLERSNATKLTHDAEQFRYLAQKKPSPQHFDSLARIYETVARRLPEGTSPLTAADIEALGEGYNTALHFAEAPELPQGPLGPRSDREKIIAEFASERATYFDDFLSPRAFDLFRRHLLESTIWHDFNHIGGFVASYLEDGLACPLFLQIIEDFRCAFPELLAERPLTQAWAFKGVHPAAAVDVHVDDAAISLNFWMTPTEANDLPGRGGMRVCKTAPPSVWKIQGYEQDRERSVLFLEQNAENLLVIPYRGNRATLFESRLVHSSDIQEFKNLYENHRINVTLLFGHVT